MKRVLKLKMEEKISEINEGLATQCKKISSFELLSTYWAQHIEFWSYQSKIFGQIDYEIFERLPLKRENNGNGAHLEWDHR